MKPYVFRQKDLPVSIVIVGDAGEREVYQLTPASRKFGASLQKVVGQLRDLVLRFLDHK